MGGSNKVRGVGKNRKINLRVGTFIWYPRVSFLVYSIGSYGSECWVLKESDKKRIEGFEFYCYRSFLRIS